MHWVRLQAPLVPVVRLCGPRQQFLCFSRSFSPIYDYGRPLLRENKRTLPTLQHRERTDDVKKYRRRKRQRIFARGWRFKKPASPTWAAQNLWAWLIGSLLPSHGTSASTRPAAAPLSCGVRRGFHGSAALWVASRRDGEEGDNVENRDGSGGAQGRQDGAGEEGSMEQLGGERQQESLDVQNGEVQLQPEKTAGRLSVAEGSASVDTCRTGGYSLEVLLDNIAKAQKAEVWICPQKQVKVRRTTVMTIDDLVVFLREENAQDICVIKVPPEREYVDYFVVCGGMGTRHIRRIADNLVAEVKVCGDGRGGRVRVEGKDSDSWMVVDLGSMVVHLMSDEARQKFELEKLWTLGPEYDDQLREMHKWLRALEDMKVT